MITDKNELVALDWIEMARKASHGSRVATTTTAEKRADPARALASICLRTPLPFTPGLGSWIREHFSTSNFLFTTYGSGEYLGR